MLDAGPPLERWRRATKERTEPSMMDQCDVLIVGGGPAGSACAGALRRAGLDVLVIDRKPFPRDKTCAGWVTPQVFEVLGIDPRDYGRGRVCQPITGFRTGLIGGEEVGTDYGRIVSYGIRRCEFDHFLLQAADVRCRTGEPVDDLARTGEGWTVNGRIRASALVGAGGHFCPVARWLGGREGDRLVTVAAQEVEFRIPPEDEPRVNVRGEAPEIFFCEDLAGYGWCFRKGDYLNIGLGRLNSRNVSSHVDAFCKFLSERGKVRCKLPDRFHGHAYRLYERIQPTLIDDRVLLVGDAAGLAYPQSGEGIRPAVESGLLAAEVLVAAGGDYRCANLEPYAARIAERFGSPRSSGPSDWLPAAFLQFAARRLLSTRWFTRRVVLDSWFLHADTPAMLPAAACAASAAHGLP
jgi:geranylgeranyl reductase family protein